MGSGVPYEKRDALPYQVPPERGSLDRQGHRRDRIVRTPTLGVTWEGRASKSLPSRTLNTVRNMKKSLGYWLVSFIFTTYTLYCRRHRHTKE
jgi:hypothetical protein